MRISIITLCVLYLVGFVAVFWMHMQMPVTFGLALARSMAWPASLAMRELWPKGVPMTVDCDGPDCG